MDLTFEPTIGLAQIGTLLSVIVATATLLIAVTKDRNLRRKQYADRIRNAAAETTALLDRWRQLSLRLYVDIQPAITEADSSMACDGNVLAVRDQLFRALHQCRLEAAQRITDVPIEVAYVNLYGYDPHIYELFSEVADHLRGIEEEHFKSLLMNAQADIFRVGESATPPGSAQLANALQETANLLRKLLDEKFVEVISPLRQRLIDAINASDGELVGRRKL